MSRTPLTATLALALALGGGAMLAPSAAFAKADSAAVSQTFDRASAMFGNGKYRDATIELKNVLRENPDHARARLMLGKIALRDGDLETAEKEIGRAHRLAPDDETSVLLGEIALQRGKPEEALDFVEGDAATDDLRVQKYVIRGSALISLGRMDEAKRVYDDVVGIDARRVEGHFGLARVYAARKDYTLATDKIDEIVKGKPDYAPGWILRGEISLATNDKHAAFYSFDKAVTLQPDDIGPLISRARASLANGDIESARRDARAVARLSPGAPVVHYLDAATAFAEGDYDAANNSFTQVQRSFDNFSPAVLLGALIKTEREEYSQADALFQRYIAMEPNNLDARRAMATVRLRMGQPSNAIDILERLLASAPQDTGTRRKLASAYLALDRFDEARRNFAVLAESSNARERNDARNALALLESTGGDGDLRIAVLKASDALSNGDAGAAKEALDSLDESLQRSARVLALRGGIAAKRGDIEGAKTSLDAALEADPELAVAHQARERLDDSSDATIDRLRSLQAANPDSEFLTLRLARQMASDGRGEDAIAILRDGTRRLPGSAGLSKALISGSILTDRFDDAAREAARLSALPDASLDDLSFATMSLIDVKAGDAAVVSADRLVKKAPDSQRAVIVKAEALDAADRTTEAYAVLRKAMARWPGDTALAATMVNMAIERRQLDVAQEAARGLARRDPSASARLLAQAAAGMGQPVLGVDVLERAFRAAPDGQLATALYGARVQAGRGDAAKAGLRKWVEANPRDRGALIAYATALMDREEYTEAEIFYGNFLQLEPGNPVALNNYAWLRHRSGRPDALDYAERAFDAAGGAPEIADTYGWMLVQYGKLDRGLALLARATEMAPDNPEIGYHYAAALSKAGRGSEARTILTGVLDSGGKFSKRGEAESLLSSLR